MKWIRGYQFLKNGVQPIRTDYLEKRGKSELLHKRRVALLKL